MNALHSKLAGNRIQTPAQIVARSHQVPLRSKRGRLEGGAGGDDWVRDLMS
jgi:hypothetical protein